MSAAVSCAPRSPSGASVGPADVAALAAHVMTNTALTGAPTTSMVASSSFPASEQQTTRPCRGLHGRDPPTRGAPDSKTNLRRVNMSSTERARPVGGLRGVNGANCSSSHPNPPEDGKGSNPSLSACQTYLGARPLLACASRTLRIQRPRGSAARPRLRRLAWRLSAPASLCLARSVQGGYCTPRPAGVGRWRLGPAQEGVANPVRSGRKQRYRMSSCAAGRPSRYRRTPRASTQ